MLFLYGWESHSTLIVVWSFYNFSLLSNCGVLYLIVFIHKVFYDMDSRVLTRMINLCYCCSDDMVSLWSGGVVCVWYDVSILNITLYSHTNVHPSKWITIQVHVTSLCFTFSSKIACSKGQMILWLGIFCVSLENES